MATFDLINSYVVSNNSTTSITFSSIPQTYTDLCLYASSKADYTSNYVINYLVQYNNQSTSSSYNGDFAYFTSGSTNTSLFNQTQSGGPVAIITSTGDASISNFFGINWSYIGNYTSTVAKQERMYIGSTDASTGIWNFGHARPISAEAINSLTIVELSGRRFIEDSTFYLYGVKNN